MFIEFDYRDAPMYVSEWFEARRTLVRQHLHLGLMALTIPMSTAWLDGLSLLNRSKDLFLEPNLNQIAYTLINISINGQDTL